MGEGDDDPSMENLHLVAEQWLKNAVRPVSHAFKLTAKELEEILVRPTSSYSNNGRNEIKET
jgi:hypothetical protein